MKNQSANHSVLFSLGSNSNAENNLKNMLKIMQVWWKDVKSTPMLTNEAIDMPSGSPDFVNQLVRVSTSLSYAEVKKMSKQLEKMCGDTTKNRLNGVIIADADILMYDNEKHHKKDWNRKYVKLLLDRFFFTLILLFIIQFPAISCVAQTSSNLDKETLGRAIEYFSSQKYQEALLLFQKLENTHKLSNRFLAYKGVCEYKLDQYEKAIESLSEAVPHLKEYSPHEQAIYYYTWGECYFQLERYSKTKECFIKALELCNDNDHAEVCYRLGFSDMMLGEYENAIKWFEEAEGWYRKADNNPSNSAHREQTKRMLRALLITHGTSRIDNTDKKTGEY